MLAALVIVFRECIEAGLIIGIVLAATRGLAGRGFWVSYGVVAGLAGAALVAAFAEAISDAFAGAGQELFNVAVLGFAVIMLTWHNVWMASHGREMARQMKQVGAEVVEGRRPLAMLTLVVGVAVLREGAETVLFLTSVSASGGDSGAAVWLGGLLGVSGAAVLSALLYFGLVSIPAHRLFAVTSGLVTLLTAGLASQAIGFLQQAGYAEVLTSQAWDTSWLLSDTSIPGRLLHTLVGYTAAPNGAQVGIYLLTIATMVALTRWVRGAAPARAA